ncbi:MAG: cysteine hydrolase family protein [Clostridium sp.]
MKTNEKFLSFYYRNMKEVPDIHLNLAKTALLIVDMQKHFISMDGYDAEQYRKAGEWDEWEWFYDHIQNVVIPNNKRLLDCCRKNGVEVTYGRIASLKKNGSDRSRVQSTVGWNDIYVYVDDEGAQMVDELTPLKDEIVVNKTTDSVSLGTNYTQILHNMGIDTVIVTGVVTDQCVASTIRVLADQGFRVICPEDSCAAATQELHEAELKIMNVIYCTVMSTDETVKLIEEAAAQK